MAADALSKSRAWGFAPKEISRRKALDRGAVSAGCGGSIGVGLVQAMGWEKVLHGMDDMPKSSEIQSRGCLLCFVFCVLWCKLRQWKRSLKWTWELSMK